MPANTDVKPLWRVLAGLQAGVVAGAIMFVYIALDAGLRGATVWSVINLFSSNFYGMSALGSAFRRTTFAGLAWHVWLSGVLGLVISFALGPFVQRPARCAIIGAVLALGWYYWGVRIWWPHWNPLAGRQPFPGLLFAHVIFGVSMAAYPRFLAELRETPS